MASVAEQRHRRKVVVGVVTSDKMQKTITVEIFRSYQHPLYGKFLRRSTICKAHDEKSEAKRGDTVRIMETRPLSKTKRWRLVEILTRAREKTQAVASAAEVGQAPQAAPAAPAKAAEAPAK